MPERPVYPANRGGERVVVTAQGRVVAELVPPGRVVDQSQRSQFDRLVASGTLTPPAEDGDPLEGCLRFGSLALQQPL